MRVVSFHAEKIDVHSCEEVRMRGRLYEQAYSSVQATESGFYR